MPRQPVDAQRAIRVLRQLRAVFNAVRTHFQQVERESGLGGARLWALALIAERPGLGVNELAAALSVRQPTASNLVRSLVRLELVEARREGSDRRMVQLHAAAAASALLQRSPGPAAGVLPEALGRLPPSRLRRLETDLDALIHALDVDPRGAALLLATRRP